MNENGRHGVQLMPDPTSIFMLLFADDVVLMSDTVPGFAEPIECT